MIHRLRHKSRAAALIVFAGITMYAFGGSQDKL